MADGTRTHRRHGAAAPNRPQSHATPHQDLNANVGPARSQLEFEPYRRQLRADGNIGQLRDRGFKTTIVRRSNLSPHLRSAIVALAEGAVVDAREAQSSSEGERVLASFVRGGVPPPWMVCRAHREAGSPHLGMVASRPWLRAGWIGGGGRTPRWKAVCTLRTPTPKMFATISRVPRNHNEAVLVAGRNCRQVTSRWPLVLGCGAAVLLPERGEVSADGVLATLARFNGGSSWRGLGLEVTEDVGVRHRDSARPEGAHASSP